MSENAVLEALRRMGYSGEQMTGQGFRSMASTLLNEQGWNRDAYLEGTPLTYTEIKTLLDGISVGGRKISDVEQVLNLRNAWTRAETLITRNEFSLTKEIFGEINGLVSQNEALIRGTFGTENLGIGGTTTWTPPIGHDCQISLKKGRGDPSDRQPP
jgi:Fic family protein